MYDARHAAAPPLPPTYAQSWAGGTYAAAQPQSRAGRSAGPDQGWAEAAACQANVPELSAGAFSGLPGALGGFVRTVDPAVHARRVPPGGPAPGSGGSGPGPAALADAGGSLGSGSAASGGGPGADPAGLADRPPAAPAPAECAILFAGASFSWAGGGAGPGPGPREGAGRDGADGHGGGGLRAGERDLVLQDVSLALRAGSFTVVVGEVGAGGRARPNPKRAHACLMRLGCGALRHAAPDGGAGTCAGEVEQRGSSAAAAASRQACRPAGAACGTEQGLSVSQPPGSSQAVGSFTSDPVKLRP